MTDKINKDKVLFILGATGVGKSSLAIKLAKRFNGEIISADSVQVYKEFDIGSAKISAKEMEGVQHYGIDLLEPSECFSAFEFVEYTKKTIAQIISKGKLPIIVGGTGLYVKALVENYNFGEVKANQEFREELEKIIDEKGLDFVFNQLEELNPTLAKKTDRNNKVRVIRALEIAKFGQDQTKQESEYKYKIFALTLDREKLYQQINKRVDLMFEAGLEEEVRRLYAAYGDCQPIRAIGYKEVVSYINNELTYDRMKDLIKQHTRNYAKRQITFLKSINEINYVDVLKKNFIHEMEEEITEWLDMKS